MSEWRVKTCSITEPKRSLWRYDWTAGKWRVICAAIPRKRPIPAPNITDRIAAFQRAQTLNATLAAANLGQQFPAAAQANALAAQQSNRAPGLGTLGGILGLPSFPH